MVRVGDVLAYVSSRLGFSEQSAIVGRGSVESFYRHLNYGIFQLARKWPMLKSEEDLTTTADSGILTLPTDIRIIRIVDIVWPTAWTSPIEFITNQKMANIRRRISGGETFNSTQPTYWTWYQTIESYLELQNSDSIEDGTEITVKYSYVYKLVPTGSTFGKDEIIPIPLEYELALSLYVAKSLAPRNNPELYMALNREYAEELIALEVYRTRDQFNQTHYTDRLRF